MKVNSDKLDKYFDSNYSEKDIEDRYTNDVTAITEWL